MKILFKCYSIDGGAPISLLEYMKIAINYGYEVIFVCRITNITSPGKYIKNGIKVIDMPYYSTSKPIKNMKTMLDFFNILRDEKPDLVITSNIIDGIMASIICEYFKIPLLPIITGAQTKPPILPKFINNTEIVVFSMENKEELIKQGYNHKFIDVISNRIICSSDDKYYDFYKQISIKKSINLLLVSTLDKDKINSVYYIINLVEELATKYNVILNIVGGGALLDEVKIKVSEVNKERKIINIVGHTDNVINYIKDAHIVFGKGRSVIEPIMMNRIGIIVGEDRKISVCSIESVDNLYYYNFSGRNIQMQTTELEINKIIEDLLKGTFNYQLIEEVSSIVRKVYDISAAKDKIGNLLLKHIRHCDKNERKENFIYKIIKIIYLYLRFYYFMIYSKIKQ